MPLAVAAVTGSMEDFSVLKPVLESLNSSAETELRLYATGGHIEGRLGRTVDQVKGAGFTVAKQVDIFMQDDSVKGSARSAALAMMGFADIFDADRPDVLLVSGDSVWVFGAISAASFFKVAVVKIDGDTPPQEVTAMIIDACKR